uniref:hypothetical protein n=1 Tax=Actinoalloteichus spitiensis TaxID=252394 RepID=UPI000584F5E7
LSHPAWEAVRKHLQCRHLLLRGVVRASPAPGAPVVRRHQLTEGGRELVGRLTPLLMIVLDYFEFRG